MSDLGSDYSRLRFNEKSEIGYVEEILINILSRLPVKAAATCKCVAKHWLRLISEPHFTILQLSWSKQTPKYLLCLYPEDFDIITHLSLMDENGEITENIPLFGFEDICSPEMTCFLNGLICSVDDDHDVLNEVNIRIFNPFTRDSVILPRGTRSGTVPSVGIVFDPQGNNFKAFRFFSDLPDDDEEDEKDVKYKCEVYASNSKAWRLISEDTKQPDRYILYPFCPHYVSIDGSMYWFVWSSQDTHAKPITIFSVDMKDNFAEMGLPKMLSQSSFLIELEGCLSVVHVDQLHDPKPHVEVYKWMKSCEWRLRASAEMDVVDIDSFTSVAALCNNLFFIMRLANESLCYHMLDLDEGTWKMLDLHESLDGYMPVAFPFVESLLKCSGM